MTWKKVSIIIFAFHAITSCIGSKPMAENPKWKLVWNDEFDYKGLPDSTRWSYDTRGNSNGWGNNELQYYTEERDRNVRVNGKNLQITVHKEQYNKRKYTSARLISKDKGDWKYGRIEVRSKLPGGRGTWPAIWMLPTNNRYGGWPASGEIDIMEQVGFEPDSIHTTVHTQAFNHIKNTQKGAVKYLPNCESDFHLYAIE